MNQFFPSTPANGVYSARRRSVTSLGKVISEHQPSVSNQISALILGTGFAGGGVALEFFIVREIVRAGDRMPLIVGPGLSWGAAILGILVGLVLIAIGLALAHFGWTHLSFRLFVCAEGFYYVERGTPIVFGWDEIESVAETTEQDAGRVSRSYVVRRCDGKEFFLNPNTIPRPSLIAGPLVAAARKWGITWLENGFEVFPGGILPDELNALLYEIAKRLYRDIPLVAKRIAPRETIRRALIFYYDTTTVGDPYVTPFLAIGPEQHFHIDHEAPHLLPNEVTLLPDLHKCPMEACGDEELGKIINAVYAILCADESTDDSDDDVTLRPFRETLHRTAIRLNRLDWSSVLLPTPDFAVLVSDYTGYWTDEDCHASLPRDENS